MSLRPTRGGLPSERIKALRADGMPLRKIAAEVGVSYQAVRRVLDPEGEAARVRRGNAKRAAAKRAWENQNDRPSCSICGGLMGVGAHRSGYIRCKSCKAAAEQARLEEMIRLRCEDGLSNVLIAERLQTSTAVVATLLHRARKAGRDVPRDPYMERRREVLADAA